MTRKSSSSRFFAELVELHNKAKRKVDFEYLVGSLQQVFLQSHINKLDAGLKSRDAIGYAVVKWKGRISSVLGPDSRTGRICTRWLDLLNDFAGHGGDEKAELESAQMKQDIDNLNQFSRDSVSKAVGHKFTVEDVHGALIDLGQACIQKRVLNVGQSILKKRQESQEDEEGESEIFVGPADDEKAMKIELRALKIQNEELHEERAQIQEKLHHVKSQLSIAELNAERHRSISIREDDEVIEEEIPAEELPMQAAPSGVHEEISQLKVTQAELDAAKHEIEMLKDELRLQNDKVELKMKQAQADAKKTIKDQAKKIKDLLAEVAQLRATPQEGTSA